MRMERFGEVETPKTAIHHFLLLLVVMDELGRGRDEYWLCDGEVHVTGVLVPWPPDRDLSPLEEQQKTAPWQDIVIHSKVLPQDDFLLRKLLEGKSGPPRGSQVAGKNKPEGV